MASLSGADYRGVLAVLREAGDVAGPAPFPRRVLEALRRLVPCDVVTYHEHIPGQPRLLFVGEPCGPVTPEIHAACRRYRHQDPLRPANGARKYSDYLSRREHHRLELYQEADRPLGIEHMMRLWLDPTGSSGARFEFDRSLRDFNQRDRAVLDVLLPHLGQFRRSATVRRSRSTRAESLLTSREREILERVAEGKTNGEVADLLGISAETVRKHLENTYRKLAVHTRTGAVAALFQLDPRISRDQTAAP